MSYFNQIHGWSTDITNCMLGNIDMKLKMRRKIIVYMLSILELSDESRCKIIKEMKEYLIYN